MKKNWKQALKIYSQDIGMEFGKEKGAMLIISRKLQKMKGIKLPNQEIIRMLKDKETHKHMGILKVVTIKQEEMKEKIQKEYLRRTRKLLETKLYSRNLIKGINTWAVPFVRYSGPFLKWKNFK